MVVIPIINKTFDIKVFQKLIPYANVLIHSVLANIMAKISPYTFPIGVGEDNLGLMFTNIKLKKQTFVKNLMLLFTFNHRQSNTFKRHVLPLI